MKSKGSTYLSQIYQLLFSLRKDISKSNVLVGLFFLLLLYLIFLSLGFSGSNTNTLRPTIYGNSIPNARTSSNLQYEESFLTHRAVCSYRSLLNLIDDTSNNLFLVAKVAPVFGFDRVKQMVVYANNDIVSLNIKNGGAWDAEHTSKMINALKKLRDMRNAPVSFLDIGGNVGWFTVAAAAAGFPTFTFEPMSTNAWAFRTTICLNPELQSLVTFFNIGLGDTERVCNLISGEGNRGNGQFICSEDKKDLFMPLRDSAMRIVKLDDVISSEKSIGVAKIDVEGFELHVVKGGTKTLLSGQIPYISAEYYPKQLRIKGTNPADFLLVFLDSGYKISIVDFNVSPFLSRDDIVRISDNLENDKGVEGNMKSPLAIIDVYMTYNK